MKKKQENITYLVLTLIACGLLVYLVIDAATAYRGQDITLDDLERIPTPTDDEILGQQSGARVFEQRDLLFPIVTPEPTPTREILPTPTPTPIPFAERWVVKSILGNFVQFVDETGLVQTKEKGDEHFGVLIQEVNGREGYIVIQYLPDGLGRTKTLKKEGIP